MNYLKDKFFVGLLKLIFIRYFVVFIRMTIFHCKENERNINGYYNFLNKKDFFFPKPWFLEWDIVFFLGRMTTMSFEVSTLYSAGLPLSWCLTV